MMYIKKLASSELQALYTFMMVHTYTNLQYTTTLRDVQEKVQFQRQQQSLYSRKHVTWSLLRNCINQGMTFHIEYDVFIHKLICIYKPVYYALYRLFYVAAPPGTCGGV